MDFITPPPEIQAGTQLGPDTPARTRAPSPAPGASPVVGRGPVPETFRLACPACGTEVLFPFDPGLSARLDLLLLLEEHLYEMMCGREEVAR